MSPFFVSIVTIIEKIFLFYKTLEVFMKKLVSFLICLVLLAVPSISLHASALEQQTKEEPIAITPQYLYTSSTSTNIGISNSVATCLGSVIGYNGVTTKVHIYLYLQKLVNGSWTTCAQNNQVFNTYRGTFSMTPYVDRGGNQYRVKASYYVYSGSKYENIVSYSKVAMW